MVPRSHLVDREQIVRGRPSGVLYTLQGHRLLLQQGHITAMIHMQGVGRQSRKKSWLGWAPHEKWYIDAIGIDFHIANQERWQVFLRKHVRK